jgi:class III poly(R)-hydroxyalkanoic acid synthase PhaE subunit
MCQEMFGEYWKGAPLAIVGQTFARTLGAAQVHGKLYEFWANAAKILSGAPAEGKTVQETYQDFYNSWLQSYSEVLRGFFGVSLFEPLGWPGGAAAELMPMYGDALSKFSRPWTAAIQGLPQKTAEALQKGPQAYGDVLRWWLPAYEQTWGRLLRMPALGPMRETVGLLQQGAEALVDYFSVSTDFGSALSRVSTEAMLKVMTELGSMSDKGQAPKTFREFYKLWWTTNEEAVKELYQTPEFSRLLGRVVDALMLVRKRYHEIIEEYLKALPIPTRTEMNDLYKSLYLLKQEVRRNTKYVAELQSRLKRTERATKKEQP